MLKKVLILTVTAGNGHNSCAKAMKNELEKSGEAEVYIVDLLKEFSSKLNTWIGDQGYAFAFASLPDVYGYFYDKYRKAEPEKRYTCAAQGVANSTLPGLLKCILKLKPDVIYCTHFYAAIALTNLKLIYNLPCKCVSTLLDYVNSPFWEAGTGVDYLNLPNEDFIAEFVSEGYSQKQLVTLGIPVDGRTITLSDKEEARKKLGLDNTFTLLISFGGGLIKGGFKVFKNTLKAIEGINAQIIVSSGKDKHAYDKAEKIIKKSKLKIINVGFTENFPLYIASSDIAICKAGGLSSTEMINAGLPMLVTAKLPAQEKYNLQYLIEKGVAISFNGKKGLKDKIHYLNNHTEVLTEMAEKTLPLRRNAAEELAKLILAQPNADYEGLAVTDSEIKTVKKRVKKALKLADREERKQH